MGWNDVLNDSLTERAWHVQGHTGSPGNHEREQLDLQICNSGLTVDTDLRGINRQISSLGNVIPGLSLSLPLGASGEGSLLPQRMQILAPGWCLYDRLSWQLTPAPTSGARIQSLVPRTKILHALG